MAQYNSQGKIVERTTAIHHSSGEAITETLGLPVKIAGNNQQTIQTHNQESVALSSTKAGPWIDTNGFSEIAITFLNDATASSSGDIRWSHDGVTYHSADFTVIPSSTVSRKSALVPTKARYASLVLSNADSTAAHVMSAWFYLKA